MRRSSAIVTGADDACSGCRELFRANHQEKQSGNAKDRAVDGSTRDGIIVFGGQDDSVLSLLHPQARDLACHYRIGRGDVLRARAESDEGLSRPRRAADPVRCGSAGPGRRAAVPVRERRRPSYKMRIYSLAH